MIKMLHITIGLDKRRISFNGGVIGPDRGAAASAVSAAADLITMVKAGLISKEIVIFMSARENSKSQRKDFRAKMTR
jgi:hypothetical protein